MAGYRSDLGIRWIAADAGAVQIPKKETM